MLCFLFSALNFSSSILTVNILCLIDANLLLFKGFLIASLIDRFLQYLRCILIIRTAKQPGLIVSVPRVRNCTFLSHQFFLSNKIRSFVGDAIRNRNSCPEVFCEKGVLRNFAKLTGKHLCQSLFLNKVAGLSLFSQNTSGGCFCRTFFTCLCSDVHSTKVLAPEERCTDGHSTIVLAKNVPCFRVSTEVLVLFSVGRSTSLYLQFLFSLSDVCAIIVCSAALRSKSTVSFWKIH